MKESLSLLFLLAFSSCLWAQKPAPEDTAKVNSFVYIPKGNIIPNVTPPGPEAYALGKFGDIPVSLYTGVPNIEIPITSITDKDIHVKVRLSYHSAGNKVDEISSWVGLGWALETGGTITRIVNHKAESLQSNGTIFPPRAYIDIYRAPKHVDNYIFDNHLQATADGSYDAEPDGYIFNFLGKTGKFYLDSTGAALLYNHEGLKVKFEYANSFTRFVITAVDGTRYEFGREEAQTNVSGNQPEVTSWHLTKILSPGGGAVTFEYQGFASIDVELRNTDNVVEITSSPAIFSNQITPEARSSITEWKIQKIITSNGYIEFTPGTVARKDIRQQSTYPLSEIVVYNAAGNLLKRFKLYTGYFEANNDRKYSGADPNVYKYLNYRLRLDSLQEFDAQNAKLPPFKLTYLGDDNPATPDLYTMPNRFSADQDHWGYYNGKSNSHLFPGNPSAGPMPMDRTYEMFGSPSGYGGAALYTVLTNGADRSVDTVAVKACMLRKIQYPTGGYSQFSFESNHFGEYGCGVRIKEIADYTTGQPAKVKRYTYESGTITNHPKDFYYKYYPVEYTTLTNTGGYRTFLRPAMIEAFGVPLNSAAIGTVMKYVKILAFPQNRLGSSSQIGYSVVTEAEAGIGKTINYFETALTFPDYSTNDDIFDNIDFLKIPYQFQAQYAHYANGQIPLSPTSLTGIGAADFPYPPVYSNEWKRGVLTAQVHYNQNNVEVKRISNVYARKLLRAIKGWKVVSFDEGTQFIAARYFVPQGWLYQTKQEITEYDDSGQNGYKTVHNYFYDDSTYAQLTRQTTLQSTGQNVSTYFNFPQSYQNTPNKAPFIQKMMDANAVGIPIEKITRFNRTASDSIVVDAETTTFKTVSGSGIELILPYKQFRFNALASVGSPSFNKYPGTSDESASDSYREMVKFNTYDALGNPTLVTEENGMQTSLSWYSSAGTKNLLQSKTSAVGTSEAQTTTYTHKPLVGVETITDPSGKTLYYDYDTFGRLKNIRSTNASGAVRAAYCYNYASQAAVDCAAMAPAGSIAAGALSLIAEQTGGPLPVNLLDFEAVKNENNVALTWTTTAENNSDRFEVERSTTGKTWTTIGSVPSHGGPSHGGSTEQHTYAFTDTNPKAQMPQAADLLYRLKMVDVDETFAYSHIRSVHFGNEGISLYPNPVSVSDRLQIASDYLDKITQVQAYDASGKNIPVLLTNGNIDVTNWPQGLYTIQVQYTDGSISTHKVVKQ